MLSKLSLFTFLYAPFIIVGLLSQGCRLGGDLTRSGSLSKNDFRSNDSASSTGGSSGGTTETASTGGGDATTAGGDTSTSTTGATTGATGGTAPTITGLTINRSATPSGIGQTLAFDVTLSENVTVSAGSDIKMKIIKNSDPADFRMLPLTSHTSTQFTFSHDVIAGNPEMIGISVDSIVIYAGQVTDSDNGAAVDLSFPGDITRSFNDAGIDGIRPFVSSASVDPSSGNIITGSFLTMNIDFNEAVTLSGSGGSGPSVGITIGSDATQSLIYHDGSGSADWSFKYQIQAADSGNVSVSGTSISLNGRFIRDRAGNDADGLGVGSQSLTLIANPPNPFTYTWQINNGSNSNPNRPGSFGFGAQAELLHLDQTDNITSDYNGSGYAGSIFDGTNLRIDGSSLNAQYESRVMNAYGPADWSMFKWTPEAPYGKPLPNNGGADSVNYNQGAVNMSGLGSSLLFHFEDGPWTEDVPSQVDENSGANLSAQVTGNIGGSPQNGLGKIGKSIQLDGVDDVLIIPHHASLISNPMSFEFWMKLVNTFDTTADSSVTLIDKGNLHAYLDRTDGRFKVDSRDSSAPTGTSSTIGTSVRAVVGFKGHLYAAHEAASGASRLRYCTRDVTSGDCTGTWNSTNIPGSLDITSLVVHAGQLYAATANPAGIYVCSGADGICNIAGEWTSVTALPTGITGLIEIRAMASFQGTLFVGGYDNADGNGDIFSCTSGCSSGANWGAIPSYDSTRDEVNAFTVFNGRLYAAFGGSAASESEVRYYDGSSWLLARAPTSANAVTSLGSFNGRLYAGLQSPIGISVCTPTNGICNSGWSDVVFPTSSPTYNSVESLVVYGDKLLAGLGWGGDHADIVFCNSSNCNTQASWNISANAFQSFFYTSTSSDNSVSSMMVYQGKLYAGTGGTVGKVVKFNGGLVATTNKDTWSPGWYHVVYTLDGTGQKIFVNNINETFYGPGIPSFSSSIHNMRVGAAIGNRSESHSTNAHLSGNIDELAFYTSSLSMSEVAKHYERGAVDIRYQVRACPTSDCSGVVFTGVDGLSTSYIRDSVDASFPGIAGVSLSNGIFQSKPYFQYKVFLSRDDVAIPSPLVRLASVTPQHYDAGMPYLELNTVVPFETLTSFSHTLAGGTTGNVSYQLSNNGGTTYYYHNGAAWVPSGGTSTNTASQIQSYISTFPMGSGSLKVKAFFESILGVQQVGIQNVIIQGTN